MPKGIGGIHEDFSRDTVSKVSSDRAFGLIFAAFFAIIGIFPSVHGGAIRIWALVAGVVFLTLAVSRPQILHPLNRLWARLGLFLNRVVNPIVMAILFFGTVTPIAWIVHALGKDPLRLRRDPEAATYWIERTPPGPLRESMRDQF
jgi:hypothetical protein